MNVTLINYTPQALETLIFTKNTRLRMSPKSFEEVCAWPEEKKLEELEYMRHTIQSQFEFVDYIFAIEGVTRAFTHQLVRHRVGTSFAQQSQRALDMSGFDYITGPSILGHTNRETVYQNGMAEIEGYYSLCLEEGVKPQDARGLLPTNIATNITFKANLRTLHDMAQKRLCVKAQGEFQDVFRALRLCVIAAHPWAEPFIRVWCATYGTCMFHTFPVADCPTKPIVYDPWSGEAYGGGWAATPDLIQIKWEQNRAEAYPKVPQGE